MEIPPKEKIQILLSVVVHWVEEKLLYSLNQIWSTVTTQIGGNFPGHEGQYMTTESQGNSSLSRWYAAHGIYRMERATERLSSDSISATMLEEPCIPAARLELRSSQIFTLTQLTDHAASGFRERCPIASSISLQRSLWEEGGIMLTVKIWFKECHPLSQSQFQSKKDECEDEKQ